MMDVVSRYCRTAIICGTTEQLSVDVNPRTALSGTVGRDYIGELRNIGGCVTVTFLCCRSLDSDRIF